jgi:hypothetical protein
MRPYLAGLIVAALVLVGVVAVTSTGSDRSSNCPEPSARSVESLFAPCLERHAMNER